VIGGGNAANECMNLLRTHAGECHARCRLVRCCCKLLLCYWLQACGKCVMATPRAGLYGASGIACRKPTCS
jgi:hypothetical protein